VARVDFYHLTRDPAPAVLARLASRVLSGGDRLLVVAATRDQREAIDAGLWTAIPESFLPHLPADKPGEGAAEEPILIAADLSAPANGARLVALADGEWRDEALGFDRVLLLFDGAGIDGARAAWKSLAKREGVDCHYWRQDHGGRWQEGP
jgi:DNA polymerase III subunit chi